MNCNVMFCCAVLLFAALGKHSEERALTCLPAENLEGGGGGKCASLAAEMSRMGGFDPHLSFSSEGMKGDIQGRGNKGERVGDAQCLQRGGSARSAAGSTIQKVRKEGGETRWGGIDIFQGMAMLCQSSGQSFPSRNLFPRLCAQIFWVAITGASPPENGIGEEGLQSMASLLN